VVEGVILIENEGGLVENGHLGQGPELFVVAEEGLGLIEKEGGSGIENKIEVGIVEEGVILIEKEGGARVENNDFGQGPESCRIEVAVAEEGVILIENEGDSEV
jgi:hypothetical protein